MENPEKKVKVAVKLNTKDCFRFQIHYLLSKVAFRIQVFLSIVLPFWLSMAVLKIVGLTPSKVIYAVFLGLPAITFIMIPIILYFSARMLMSSNPFLKEEQHYTFDAEGIGITSVSRNQHIGWNKTDRVNADKNNFYIFISKKQAFIIPKRSFANPEEITDFKEILDKSLMRIK